MILKVYVQPRMTENWDDLDPISFLEDWNNIWAVMHPNPQEIINARENMWLWYQKRPHFPYIKFRAELKKIAQQTWTKANLECYDNQDHEKSIIIPIDDDDWLAPNIKYELEKAFEEPEVICVLWDIYRYDSVFNNWSYAAINKGEVVHSCAYALRKSFANDTLIASHMAFSDFFKTCPPKKYRIINKPLSVYNFHPAGICFHRWGSFYDFKNTEFKFPNNLSWGLEETKKLNELLCRLNRKRILI